MRHRSSLYVILACLLLFVMAAPAGAGGGWQEGALTFTGGPGCDMNENGIGDGWLDHGGINNAEGPLDGHFAIPFDYRTAGKMTAAVMYDEGGLPIDGKILSGKYTMRFDDAHYYQNEDTISTPAGLPEEILVTGRVTFSGGVFSSDFSDISKMMPLNDTLTLKWSYTINDIDGNYLMVTGGSLTLDTATGIPTYGAGYGPCLEP